LRRMDLYGIEDSSLDGSVTRSIISSRRVACLETSKTTFRGFDNKRKFIEPAETFVGYEKNFATLSVSSKSPAVSSKSAVPKCPGYYEPFSSFLSDSLPQRLLDSIVHYFQHQNIDFELNPQKYKLTCVFYNETNVPCAFNVSLFQCPTNKAKHLVEFQRKSGCVVSFRKLYSVFLNTFLKQGFVKGEPVPVPRSLPFLGEVELDEKTLSVMFRSLYSSECFEDSREVLRAFANWSRTQKNLVLMLKMKPDFATLLLQLLSSEDADTIRCAATILANLAAVSSVLSFSSCSSSLFNVLSLNDIVAPGFNTTASKLILIEAKRQITRCLIFLTKDLVIKEAHQRRVLEDLVSVSDKRLSGLVGEVLRNQLQG